MPITEEQEPKTTVENAKELLKVQRQIDKTSAILDELLKKKSQLLAAIQG